MKPFKKPKVTTKQLNTRVTFYEYAPKKGPLPGETQKRILKECWANVDGVWLRDVERAKENGTVNDVTITIRDYRNEFMPDLKQRVSIDTAFYKDKRYEVVGVKPDEQNKNFILVIAKLVS